ncbi:MAG TPA: hypothetical protein VKD88_02100 [Gaiellaceae bacterium]|nr:hypothetical protein [Gaiellaceae bacterium]
MASVTTHLRRNLIAYLALLFALSGTSYAAATKLLPANSVGTKQVIDHSLLKVDFKAGQLPRGARGPTGLTGLTGAAGPSGPAGPGGAQGPPGPVSLAYVASPDTPLPNGTQQEAFVDCPAGMVVTGGGAFTPSLSTAVTVNSSGISSSTGSSPDEWAVSMNNTSGSDTTFNAEAICTAPTNISAGSSSLGRVLSPEHK